MASRWRIERPLRGPSLLFLWATGSLLLFLAYAAIFASFWPRAAIGGALVAALTNVAPLAVLAAITRAVIKTYVMPLGVGAQGASHLALAPAFAVTWYGAVIVLQALRGGGGGHGVQLVGFSPIALVWQAFQGLVLYALVAAICYAVRGGREAAPVSFVDAGPAQDPPLERYLIRSGDEFVPIRVAEVAAIVGAQDYSEVTTATGRTHLVRLSLAEFERRLDPHRFVRVHRSAIVNLDRLEPAGNGRMVAHMDGAGAVEVSRSGAQALRRFVV